MNLIDESKTLLLPCFDLVPAKDGEPIVAQWGGRRSDLLDEFADFETELKSQTHLLSVEQSLFEQLGLRGRGPFALTKVITSEDAMRLDCVHVSTGKLGDVAFTNSLPLTAKPSVSIPPFEAAILYGGQAVQSWLASEGLQRWEYGQIVGELRDQYRDYFNRQLPLCIEHPPFARIGGWHMLWPDDDFYIPREMRLMVWTFQEAEPWYEVFLSPLRNYIIKSRIT